MELKKLKKTIDMYPATEGNKETKMRIKKRSCGHYFGRWSLPKT